MAAGVFYASHISSLIEVLNAQNIPFYEVGRACTASSSPINYLWVAIIAVILALLAVLFSLKHPRQQIIQAVETYTMADKNVFQLKWESKMAERLLNSDAVRRTQI